MPRPANTLEAAIVYEDHAYMKTRDGHEIILGRSDIHCGDDLKTKTPNLRLRVGQEDVKMTWDEMRELAQAMIAYCDVAEFG